MTVVFVHGVPETAEVWDKLRAHLDRDSVALGLPGFGTPVPPGFGGGKDDHVAWLVEWLRSVPGPVDLVGHDWGALFTYRVVTAFEVPLRSWAADVAGILDAAYVWHDLARLWQTPGEGESFMTRTLQVPHDEPESAAGQLRALGVPDADARAMQDRFDARMGRAVLALYRSATPNPFADWGAEIAATAAPGLVLSASDDPFDDPVAARGVARVLGARVRVLRGTGHFWMLQNPARAAEALTAFWRELDEPTAV